MSNREDRKAKWSSRLGNYASSHCHAQIAKVIAWLKLHFTEDVPMDDLAAKAHMSPSTFRQHFRVVTGMSPLPARRRTPTSGYAPAFASTGRYGSVRSHVDRGESAD